MGAGHAELWYLNCTCSARYLYPSPDSLLNLAAVVAVSPQVAAAAASVAVVVALVRMRVRRAIRCNTHPHSVELKLRERVVNYDTLSPSRKPHSTNTGLGPLTVLN